VTILLRALAPTDSVAELTTLLHAAYAELEELGLNYTAVDQSEDVTHERIASGECYVAMDGTQIVGTILVRRHPTGCFWYDQDFVAGLGQFCVLPAVQRGGIGGRLMELAENRALALGARELALDTSESALHLVQWYSRHGYRPVDSVQWDGKTYRSLILSKTLQI